MRRPILVLGPPGLLRDLVDDVVAGLDAPLDGDHVTVLVQPTDAEWAVAANDPGTRVVVVTDDGAGPASVVRHVLRGADAVVPATADPSEMEAMVALVAGGGTVLDAEAARALAEHARSRPDGGSDLHLTRREREILACIGRGLSVKQTASDLGIAHKTVENLQSRMFRKLAVRNRTQALARAYELGLLTPAVPTSVGAPAPAELTGVGETPVPVGGTPSPVGA